MLRIVIAIGALERAVGEIGGEDLDPGLCGENLHCPTGLRFDKLRAKSQVALLLVVENQAVVVAAAKLLFGDLAHAFTDGMRSAKIKRASFDGHDLPGWN